MVDLESERLRRVVFFSRYEASAAGAERIEWPHLFLGLLRQQKSIGEKLKGSKVGVSGLRRRIEASIPVRRKVSTNIDVPPDAACSLLLEFADAQAREQKRREAAPEILFASMMKAKPEWFREFGLDVETIEAASHYPGLIPPDLETPRGVILEFRSALHELEAILTPMPEERAKERLPQIDCSRKQILGRLIDAASNQHQLCVRALVSDELELHFPDYDPSAWVAAGGYQDTAWRVLMDLSVAYNRLLYDLLIRAPAEKLDIVVCRIGDRPPKIFADIVRDYIAHFVCEVRMLPG